MKIALICTIVILSIISLIAVIKNILYKLQLKDIKNQIKFIIENETNLNISLNVHNKEITELAVAINELIKKDNKKLENRKDLQKSYKDKLTELSHDLRTPLTSLSGYLQMVEKSNLSDEKKAEYLKISNQRLLIVQKMMEDMFEFLRLENSQYTFHFDNYDVADILKESIAIFYYEYKKKEVEPKICIPDEKCMFNCDAHAMTRIFNNIISNSLVHGKNEYHISMFQTNSEIKFEFKNNADNIKDYKDNVNKVFDKLFTSSTSNSTGFGLAIVKLLVENMNGKITAKVVDDLFVISMVFKK